MIKVTAAPEPADFDDKVRQPGKKFLEGCPHPKGDQWKPIWRKALGDLRGAYDSICSYSCFWVPPATGFRSVDHFEPKDDYPEKAYEWSNFRFVCGYINGKKGKSLILDPLKIEDGWFVIDFYSRLVKPDPNLGEPLKTQVSETCRILGLNDQTTCVAQRDEHLTRYCMGGGAMWYLEKDAPFLAKELKRQKMEEKIKVIYDFS